MNTQELNEYIKNYLQNDKTQRAIMLTAPWGSGKSYYVKYELCPYLLKYKLDYAVVSLYGLKDIKDLNKNLYIELRTKKTKTVKFINGISNKCCKNNSKEVMSTGKLIGKTIVKGIASFFNVNLDVSDHDLERLYRSIDLRNKLIIFEDVERSGIDLIEFMGYVNNIVEQDGIKVLLVVNEYEILKYHEIQNEDTKKIEYILTDEAENYLRIKEKTVCDTIQFTCDYYSSIKNIVEQFSDNIYFDEMLKEKDRYGKVLVIKEIEKQMIDYCCRNYRSLLFACQKTHDMLNLLDDEDYNPEFIKNLFIITIVFSFNFNSGNEKTHSKEPFLSLKGFSNPNPTLPKVMDDFIKLHSFDIRDFKNAEKSFLELKDSSRVNETLSVIYYYHLKTEKEVKEAVDKLSERLKKDKGINHNEYIKVANYLIAINTIIDYPEIEFCLQQMLTNTSKALKNGEEIQTDVWDGLQLHSKEEIEKFNNFKSNITYLVKTKNSGIYFDYKPESISNYYHLLSQGKQKYLSGGGFANKLDIDKLLQMLKKCTSQQLYDFRGILQLVYLGIANIREFLSGDVENLIKLKNGVDEIIAQKGNLDAIQLLQMKWLSGNLDQIIKTLQGGKNGE